jgi:ATP-dependent Clp protease ATP-binding subunit ClpC
MFERYTERARRVIFFARYEASQLGSNSIETEHLLLGLIREGKGLTSRIFGKSHLSMESIRKEIEGRALYREKVSTSVDIPLSPESKRVLGFASEEAERMLHNYIGTEHILLGLMREEKSVAAAILGEKGMRLTATREDIVQLLNEKANVGKARRRPSSPSSRGISRRRRPGGCSTPWWGARTSCSASCRCSAAAPGTTRC